jgi:uncharacterized membrane protein YbhN (UPF0104 family)
LAALTYVGWKLYQDAGSIAGVMSHLSSSDWVALVLALLFIPINQGIESYKWMRLIRKTNPHIDFLASLSAVLIGNTLGIFTPNRLGEYVGRVQGLPDNKRWQGLSLLLMDRAAQMLTTIATGTWGICYLLFAFRVRICEVLSLPPLGVFIVILALGIGTFMLVIGLVFIEKIARFRVWKVFPTRIFQKMIEGLEDVAPSDMMQNLALSLLRNGVFSIQYFLLLLAFGYEGPILLGFSLIWIVFLIKSIIPSLSLAELGIRESVALTVMGGFGIPVVTIIAATFLLYLYNIALPAIAGIFFVSRSH